jgi:hypothetical protein
MSENAVNSENQKENCFFINNLVDFGNPIQSSFEVYTCFNYETLSSSDKGFVD